MMHDIGVELKARLVVAGCPIGVVDGPETTKSASWGRERIVIERSGSDAFDAPRSQHINPRHRRTRRMAGKITIYAQSLQAGATMFEHEQRLDAILDQVLVAMDYVAAVRKNAWQPTAGAFFVPEDIKETERRGGAAYELQFTLDRAVIVRTWANAIRPEFTFGAGSLTSTTKASLAHGPDNDNDPNTVPTAAETACGA